MVAARNHMMYTMPLDLNLAFDKTEATIVRLQERFPIEVSMSPIVKLMESVRFIVHGSKSFTRWTASTELCLKQTLRIMFLPTPRTIQLRDVLQLLSGIECTWRSVIMFEGRRPVTFVDVVY